MLSRTINFFLEPFVAILLIICAIIARFSKKPIDIGLGPLPLINNIYHKKVFIDCGYSAETFVNQIWHITSDFDVRSDLHPLAKIPFIGKRINTLRFIIWSLFRYKCMVIYFNGGPLGVASTVFLWRLEPLILFLANVKTIVLGYGGDVQAMSRSPNLWFKDAMSKDYPLHCHYHTRIKDKIDLWTKYGTHVVGGCEWVDYMHHWDTLMISHFSIDTADWVNEDADAPLKNDTFKIFHAPNHRTIKGTAHVIEAVEELCKEGMPVELVMMEKRPNHEVRAMIKSCDLIIDQLIVGWYAMFAIEAMALQKPVICYQRQDLQDLYKVAGLLEKEEEIPLINATPLTIKETIRDLYEDRKNLHKRGLAGREYVIRHHSLEAIASVFGKIATELLPQNN